jgi:hypothetical protein
MALQISSVEGAEEGDIEIKCMDCSSEFNIYEHLDVLSMYYCYCSLVGTVPKQLCWVCAIV